MTDDQLPSVDVGAPDGEEITPKGASPVGDPDPAALLRHARDAIPPAHVHARRHVNTALQFLEHDGPTIDDHLTAALELADDDRVTDRIRWVITARTRARREAADGGDA